MQDTILILISKDAPSLEACDVLPYTGKALKLRNKYNRAVCFAPKSGLLPPKPGVPTYENEYTLAPWFRDQLNGYQERVFGIA